MFLVSSGRCLILYKNINIYWIAHLEHGEENSVVMSGVVGFRILQVCMCVLPLILYISKI